MRDERTIRSLPLKIVILVCTLVSILRLYAPIPITNQHGQTTETIRITLQGRHSFLVPSKPNLTIPKLILKGFGTDAKHPLKNCSATAQVRIYHTSPEAKNENWILQTLDHAGKPKLVGGDEFYVTYSDYADPSYNEQAKRSDPTAVAIPHDLGNGMYSLEFYYPPSRQILPQTKMSGFGELTVHFQYTCSIGSWDRDAKGKWIHNGSSRTSVKRGQTPAPPIQVFSFPFRNQVDFSKYNHVHCFGDSLINQLCNNTNWDMLQGHNKPPLETSLIQFELSTDRINKIFFDLSRAYYAIPEEFRGQPKLLIMGSHTWDVLDRTNEDQNVYYDDHIQAVRIMLKEIPKRFPDWHVVWKSPQAFHVHELSNSCYREEECRSRTRDMSMHWPKLLHQRQSKVVQELGVPMVDLFQTSYLSWHLTMPEDGRHYQPVANLEWMQVLGGYSLVE